MSTVVGIMDREGWRSRTDIVVIIDPGLRRLLWVPRDLYSPCIGDRINTAFKFGGHRALLAALAEHSLAADHSICLQRSALERALSGISVEVPIESDLSFEYPLSPSAPIESGRKTVRFAPPSEELSGERIHQWIGARYPSPGFERFGGDLERCRRQQVLLSSLLRAGLRYRPEAGEISCSSRAALDEAAMVDASWGFETMAGLEEVEIAGALVLVPRERPSRFTRPALLRKVELTLARAFAKISHP